VDDRLMFAVQCGVPKRLRPIVHAWCSRIHRIKSIGACARSILFVCERGLLAGAGGIRAAIILRGSPRRARPGGGRRVVGSHRPRDRDWDGIATDAIHHRGEVSPNRFLQLESR
jgi:hypothetical protein